MPKSIDGCAPSGSSGGGDKELKWKKLSKGQVIYEPSFLTDGEQVKIGSFSIAHGCWRIENWIGPIKPTHYIPMPQLPDSERKLLANRYKIIHDAIRDEFEKLAIRQGELIDQKTKLMDEVDKSFPQREGNRRVRDHILFDVPLD